MGDTAFRGRYGAIYVNTSGALRIFCAPQEDPAVEPVGAGGSAVFMAPGTEIDKRPGNG